MRAALTRSPNYKWWAFIAIGTGTFVSVVDHGTILMAMPTIADHFDANLPTAQWVVVGYALAISALLMPMGRLSDIIGRKQIYIGGFVVYIIAAALAGISQDITPLILFKVLQGVGSAMIQGVGAAMIISIFPSEERGKALGFHMAVVGAGAIAGPALGGPLVDIGWRWVFFINVPAGLLVIAAAMLVIDGKRFAQDGQRPRFDWLGAALSAGFLVTFLLAMTNGPRVGWASPPILVVIVGFGALLVSFIWWELRTPAPMLDLRLFRRKVFGLGVLAGWISFLGNSPIRFLLPFFLQPILGYSPSQMGLIMVPGALCFVIMGPISGRLSDRYGWRKFNVGGMALSASGLFLLSTVTVSSSLGLVIVALVLSSAGMGLFNSPNSSSIYSAVEANKYGVVGALTQLMRNSANVTSIAIATAIVTATMASQGYPASLQACADSGGISGVCEAFTAGFRNSALVMGCLLASGIVVSYVKGERPREVPSPEPAQPQLEGSRPD